MLLEIGEGLGDRDGACFAAFGALGVERALGYEELAQHEVAIWGQTRAIVGQTFVRKDFKFDTGDAVQGCVGFQLVVAQGHLPVGQWGGKQGSIGLFLQFGDAGGTHDFDIKRNPFGAQIHVVLPLGLAWHGFISLFFGSVARFGDGGIASSGLFGYFGCHFRDVVLQGFLGCRDGSGAIGFGLFDDGFLLGFFGLPGGLESYMLAVDGGHAS